MMGIGGVGGSVWRAVELVSPEADRAGLGGMIMWRLCASGVGILPRGEAVTVGVNMYGIGGGSWFEDILRITDNEDIRHSSRR